LRVRLKLKKINLKRYGGEIKMANRICTKHMMPDGTIMEGPTHGADQTCIEWSNGIDSEVDNMRRGGKTKPVPTKKSSGGMLVGPSHDQGGIQAIVDGTEPIEVEGGEFIINKQTVDAVGEEFLHKLNSTETTHHQGGYNAGELPLPSQFKDGGKVRRNEMARGRRAPVRRKRGGTAGKAPAKRRMARGGNSKRMARGRNPRKMGHGGMHNNSSNCGGVGQPPCNGGGGGGYRVGGRTRPAVKRAGRPMARGGRARQNTPKGRQFQSGGALTNVHCKSLTGVIDCSHARGCNWDYSNNLCK
jgi:hypothetical protein